MVHPKFTMESDHKGILALFLITLVLRTGQVVMKTTDLANAELAQIVIVAQNCDLVGHSSTNAGIIFNLKGKRVKITVNLTYSMTQSVQAENRLRGVTRHNCGGSSLTLPAAKR